MKAANKPELLLPVGNIESFYAALQGGADAIYLGLKKFNARARAFNFTTTQLAALVDIASKKGVKVYVTVNVVIKNSDLPEIIDLLFDLSHLNISGVIIQDWGVFYLIKKFFPSIKVHASTQMANHNSLGAIYSKQKGFERIILARELTSQEIQEIAQKTTVELELFVHGALCYSFSGMCLFSSYIGGMSANRGLCKQPCRRAFLSAGQNKFAFNLKDNQLLEKVGVLQKMGIASLKVEGRVKTPEYVYNVARAYRLTIDYPQKVEEAKEILRKDLGREKTSYFFGGDVSEAISDITNTGLFVGEIIAIQNNGFEISCNVKLQKGNRIRVYSQDNADNKAVTVNKIDKTNNGYFVYEIDAGVNVYDHVFLVEENSIRFSNRLNVDVRKTNKRISFEDKKRFLKTLFTTSHVVKEEFFVRLDAVEKINDFLYSFAEQIIIPFSKSDLNTFDFEGAHFKKYSKKIAFELPRFISEKNIPFYRKIVDKFIKSGVRNFYINHMSQKNMIGSGARVHCTENVYAFNDATIKFFKQENVHGFIYPFENGFDNLNSYKNKQGIVPVYFYPHLFFSRMPVNIDRANSIAFENTICNVHVVNGVTVVTPSLPVSFSGFMTKLRSRGFKRFLIDLSFEKQQNRFKEIIGSVVKSENITPSKVFNFKAGFK